MPATTIESDGARLAVHVSGQGPLVVLVHGFPLDRRMWDAQVGPLGRSHQVAALDLRGHGDSAWAGDEVHSMERLADDVAAVILALAPDGRADVVGLSMGGYVALALWERHATLVRSMALVDTRAGSDSEAGRAARDALIATAREHGAGRVADALLPRLVASSAAPAVVDLLRDMIEETPVETIVADLRGMRERPDRLELLASIDVPTLVVVGEHDVMTPPDDARAMVARLPGAQLEIVPGAGHMAPMEAPEICSAILARHLQASG